MRVADWAKWTRAKKKLATFLAVVGVFVSFGVESSLWWGVLAIIMTLMAIVVVESIAPHEW